MNEQDLKKIIKESGKTPSADFTDKVMEEISSLQHVTPTINKRIFGWLLCACSLLFILSVFIRIPEFQIAHYSIRFSPVIMPIITLIFTFIIFWQLYDVRSLLTDNRHNNVSQQMIY